MADSRRLRRHLHTGAAVLGALVAIALHSPASIVAAQGRLDAFFLSGGQIDGQANINLLGIGAYPGGLKQRFPGSFGSAYLYFLVPRVILFREEHTPRVLVPKVDFISSPGTSAPGVYRPGGPRVHWPLAIELAR